MVMFPKFQDALVALPTVIALDALLPGGVESLPEEVYDALRRDEMTEALAAAERWLGEADDELAPRIGYALMLEGCDKLEEALEVVGAGRELFGGRPELLVAEAEIRLERGEAERAEELLDRLRSDREDSEAVDPAVLGFVADLLLDLGREDAALETYERALEGGLEDFEATIRLAKLLEGREEWSRAAEYFERAAELGGDVVGPWAEAADCWERAGELRRSLEARKEVLERRSGDAEIWAKQGVGFRRLGDLEQAARALEKATRFAPEEPVYWIERAEVLADRGRLERAIDCYRRVLEFDPEYLDARIGLAAAALRQGDPARAARLANEAIEIEEASAEAHWIRGRALREQNDHEGAITELRRCVELDADGARYRRELGEALLEAGETERGLGHLERAVELADEEFGTEASLAGALLREQHYDRLRELLDSDASSIEGTEWELLRPVYSAVLAGIDEDDARRSRAVERLADAIERRGERLPLEYDFREIERFATVLDAEFSGAIEAMVDALEGRSSADELRQRAP